MRTKNETTKRKLTKLSNDMLTEILNDDNTQYESEAIEIAKNILVERNLNLERAKHLTKLRSSYGYRIIKRLHVSRSNTLKLIFSYIVVNLVLLFLGFGHGIGHGDSGSILSKYPNQPIKAVMFSLSITLIGFLVGIYIREPLLSKRKK